MALKVYTYDQLMNMLESLRNGFALEPDVKSEVFSNIRNSARAHGVDIAPYEEFMV